MATAPGKLGKTFEQFYEGFTNSRATQEAIKDDKISSKTKKTLDTYFRRAYSGKPAQPAPQKLPAPYDKLLPLQDKAGKWNDLQAVLDCLDMPEGTTLDQNLEEWEEATVGCPQSRASPTTRLICAARCFLICIRYLASPPSGSAPSWPISLWTRTT